MKIINKKVMFLFSAILLLSIAVFSVIPLLFADEENEEVVVNDKKVAASTLPAGKTIIDYIIDNSNDPESTDQTYHVLEIYSGSTPSSLKDMVEGGNFEKYVFDGNKSEGNTATFNPGKIDYTGLNMKSADDTLIAAINKADLIYFSEDMSAEWSDTNDISEAVKDALAKYATSDNKPLIIDSHTLGKEIAALENKTVKNLVENYYAKSGSKYNTYSWTPANSAEKFMDPADLSDLYVGVQGDIRRGSFWAKSVKTETSGATSTTKTDYIAKVLTIQAGASDNALTTKFKESFDGAYDFTDATVDPATFNKTGEVLNLKTDSAVYKYGYFGNQARPQAMLFETVDMSNATQFEQIKNMNFSEYDFVIFEVGTKNIRLDTNQDVFNALISAMYSRVHILYNKDLAPNGGSDDSTSELKARNIGYVYDKVATSTDERRYDHILVTARKLMDVYAAATTGKGVKDIADIINAGTFRGLSTGGGDSSTVYTVLEIEPCYPINTDLAAKLYSVRNFNDPLQKNNKTFIEESARKEAMEKQWTGGDAGFYYLRTDAVSSSTPDEITFGDNKPLTELLEDLNSMDAYLTQENIANVTDYYSWALSKAKIAHATGRDYNKLKVVHMSAVEFMTSRKTLLDNYDAIYIGGNSSAIKPRAKWYSKDIGANAFTMYTHNGDAFDYLNKYNDRAGNYGMFGGNDLTYNKLVELQKYSASMPIIVDKDLSTAYKKIVNGQNQTDLDPDSNVRKLLDSICTVDGDNITGNGKNILMNFDPSQTNKTANLDGMYGNTYGGYATVFAGKDDKDFYLKDITLDPTLPNEKDLETVLNSSYRPLLAVTQMPIIYSESDKTTWIDPANIGSGLTWKVDVSINATVNLYIDDDSNGRFTKDEIVDTKSGKSVTLSFKPGKDYYGVLYWKIEAVAGNLSSSTTNVCKIKRTTQSKMYVNLLEIMPVGNKSKTASGEVNNDPRTLYLCTDCQFAGITLKGNPVAKEGMYTNKFVGRVNTYREGVPNGGGLSSTAAIGAALKVFEPTYDYDRGDFGFHTHDFGIVKYYDDLTLDGTTGWDNVATNWFDIIRDDYDVDTTIIYTDEYESLIRDINGLYAGKSDKAIDNMINGANGFNDKYNDYYNYYLAMQSIINGDYKTGTAPNYTLDLAAVEAAYPGFKNAMQTAMTNGGVAGTVEDNLNKYCASSFQMDNILTTKRAAICSSADKATDAQMGEMIDRITDPEIHRDRRKYFNLFNNFNATRDKLNDAGALDYYTYFCDWRDAKIFENFFFEMYQKYKMYSSFDPADKTLDLKEVYDCIAIGSASEFCQDDLDADSCNALLKYINKNGNVILFHDSLNVDNTATTVMTQKMSSAFGMNARHQKLSTVSNPDTNKAVALKLGGNTINTDMNYNVKTREVTIQQKAGPVTATDNSVVVKVGNATKNIAGLTNNDTGYDVEVEKKFDNVGKFNIKIYGGLDYQGKAIEDGLSDSISFSASSTDVTADLWMGWGGKHNGSKVVNFSETGNNTANHNINIKLNCLNWDLNNNNASALDYTGKLYLVIGNDVDHPIEFTDNTTVTIASNKANSSESKASYTIKSVTKKSGTLSGNGLQQIDVTVKDNEGNVLSGEKVEYTVNGEDGTASSDENGVATFYRENYQVTGYDVISDEVVETTDGDTNQTLIVHVLDVNGNPVKNKNITSSATGTLSGSNSDVAVTDEDGNATFVYKNYVESTPANPTVVPEDPSAYPAKQYFMSDTKGISLSPRMLTFKGFFKDADLGQLNANKYTLMYKYSSMHKQMMEVTIGGPRIAQQDMASEIYNGRPSLPTDKTQQNNEGIITKYPFGIGQRMKISATSPSDYAVDLEDDDLVVYYSMVGGTGGTNSSLFAADPMDGLNNYFLYQYGSVTYTGAGYSLITGWGRNNNDERKLYINIIVNSGRKSARGPSLSLYDLDTTQDKVDNGKANNDIKPFTGGNECNYYTEIEDVSDFKGFDFIAGMPSKSKLKKVSIWWDINHTADINAGEAKYDTGTDVPIWDGLVRKVEVDSSDNVIEDSSLVENMLKSVKNGIDYEMKTLADNITPRIALKEDYFDPQTGNQYAYIVVKVEDSNGEIDSATLRIQYRPQLIDLN